MAAALLQSRLPANSGSLVRSAGTNGIDGHPAHEYALDAIRKHGINISDHRAQTVTPSLLSSFDLILTMEASHRQWILSRMPTLEGRVYLLGHWRSMEILDPMSGDKLRFQQVANEINECLTDWRAHLGLDRREVTSIEHPAASQKTV